MAPLGIKLRHWYSFFKTTLFLKTIQQLYCIEKKCQEGKKNRRSGSSSGFIHSFFYLDQDPYKDNASTDPYKDNTSTDPYKDNASTDPYKDNAGTDPYEDNAGTDLKNGF